MSKEPATPPPPSPVLLLPGWHGSEPAHWQSRWQASYGYQRVEQHDWDRPLRGDWSARLEDALLACPAPAVLVAHSLGCILVAAWAAHSQNTARVKAALLVAPPDVESDALRVQLPGWAPVARQRLPFACAVVGSSDDPYCTLERAQSFARAWGAHWIDAGARGHLNAASGLGDWPQGHAVLRCMTGEARS